MGRKLVLVGVALIIIIAATSGCAGVPTPKPIFSQPCEMTAIVVGEGSARTYEVEPGGLKDYHFHVLIRGQSEDPRVEIPSFPEPAFAGNLAVQVGWEDSPRTVEFDSTLRLDRGQVAAFNCPGWHVFENPSGAYRTLLVGRDKFYLIAVRGESCEELRFYDDQEGGSKKVWVIVDP